MPTSWRYTGQSHKVAQKRKATRGQEGLRVELHPVHAAHRMRTRHDLTRWAPRCGPEGARQLRDERVIAPRRKGGGHTSKQGAAVVGHGASLPVQGLHRPRHSATIGQRNGLMSEAHAQNRHIQSPNGPHKSARGPARPGGQDQSLGREARHIRPLCGHDAHLPAPCEAQHPREVMDKGISAVQNHNHGRQIFLLHRRIFCLTPAADGG